MQSKMRSVGIAAAVVVVAALIYAVFATIYGWWPVTLDIVLIITALVSLVLLAALAYAAYSLARTALDIKNELMPVLQSLKTTSTAVREGAKTASAFGVDPAVRTAATLVGAGEVASVLLGKGEAKKRADRRRRRKMEIERELARKGELDGNR
jgi:hypothetical protein